MRGVSGRGGVRNRNAASIKRNVNKVTKTLEVQDLRGRGDILGEDSQNLRELSEERVVATVLGTIINRDKNEIHKGREEKEDKDANQMVSVSTNAGHAIGEMGSEGVGKEILMNDSDIVTHQRYGNPIRVEKLGHEEDSG